VGAEKKEIVVHSSALAELSPILNALMNGEMLEAKTSRVDWSEVVDVDTFARLCEFAYFKDYTPPSSRLVEDRSPPEAKKPSKKKKKYKSRHSTVNLDAEPAPEAAPEAAPEPEPEPEDWPEPEPSEPPPPDDPEIMYKERSVDTEQLQDTFARNLVLSGPGSEPSDRSFAPPKIAGSWEDFHPVFLGQAKLYAIADKYDIEALRQLVLQKLYQTLSTFKLYDTGVGSIIEFVRFVYLNTPPNHGGQFDALRNLATRYVISVLGQIGEKQCFHELLQDGGPFLADFWRIFWSAGGTTNVNESFKWKG
jgi:hypothetical protein